MSCEESGVEAGNRGGDSWSPPPGTRQVRWRELAFAAILAVSLLGTARRQSFPQPPPRSVKVRIADPHPGCLAACHEPHRPMSIENSHRRQTLDEICLACHGGAPQPASDMRALKLPQWSARMISHHGRLPSKGAVGKAYQRVIRQGGKQVILKDDCSACHDVHGKGPGIPSQHAFDSQGQLLGVKPMYAAQICFGCHAGPEAALLGRRDSDIGVLFSKEARSKHVIGRSAEERPDLPSLRASEFLGKLDCISCHDNPESAGPRGPHASSNASLLKAGYGREREVGGLGDQANALCFRCHDRHSIESNKSFPLHREHLTGFTGYQPRGGARQSFAFGSAAPLPLGMRIGSRPGSSGSENNFAGYGEPTPCATCHDPHGSRSNPSLISFDPAVVSRSSVGAVDFYRSGLGHGTCTMTCHGYDHIQTKY